MYVILPFEKEFYADYDYNVDFVGHPLLDAIDTSLVESTTTREKLGLDNRPVIAVLPGIRKQEIRKMLPLMLKMTAHFPDHQFIIAGAPSTPENVYADAYSNDKASVIKGRMHDILNIADAAMVTSGTATLETALYRVPEVVCYKGGWLSYQIAKRLVKHIRYISLVNLIMDREVVKELIQGDFNANKLQTELNQLISNEEYRNKMYADLDALRDKLGGSGASDKTAGLMYERLVNKE